MLSFLIRVHAARINHFALLLIFFFIFRVYAARINHFVLLLIVFLIFRVLFVSINHLARWLMGFIMFFLFCHILYGLIDRFVLFFCQENLDLSFKFIKAVKLVGIALKDIAWLMCDVEWNINAIFVLQVASWE